MSRPTKIKAPAPEIALETGVGPQELILHKSEQLAEAVNRLLRTNRELELEVARHNATSEVLKVKMEELVQALEREKEVNRLKTQFITLASHEFRTPLSTILSSAALVAKYADLSNMEKRDAHLDKIRGAATHINEILQDFLETARFEENRVSPDWAPIDINAFLKEIIHGVIAQENAENRIVFHELPGSTHINSDRRLLKQSIGHLLINALRFSKESVQLECDVSDQSVVFEVKDMGMGIPDSDQKHIFERFFRASNATHFPGIGLGLHLTQQCVHMIGGEISFQSKERKGTCFTIKIPRLQG